MGNRAIIKPKNKNIGVYLHWNGGIDSVEAFLEYCKLKGHRSFTDSYGVARFCQVVGNYFGGSCSIGIETEVYSLEHYVNEMCLDNGLYVVDGWEIVERVCPSDGREGYDRTEMLIAIDEAQPANERLGPDFFNSELVKTSDIKVGDRVVVFDNLDCIYTTHTVVGIGQNEYRNGTNVLGMPYVNKHLNEGRYDLNINNYITGEEIRRLKNENI